MPYEVTDDSDDFKPAGSSGLPSSTSSSSIGISTAGTKPVYAPSAASGNVIANIVAPAVEAVTTKAVVDYGTPSAEPSGK